MAQKLGKCEKCGVDFIWEKKGKVPKNCPGHQKITNGGAEEFDRKRTADYAAIRHLQEKGTKQHVLAADAMEAQRLAIGLSIHPTNIHLAAASVGISTKDKEHLQLLAMEARQKHQDIIDQSPGGFSKLTTAFKFLAIQLIMERIYLISPRDLATAIRNVATVEEQMGLTSQHSFSTLNINLGEDDDDDQEIVVMKGDESTNE